MPFRPDRDGTASLTGCQALLGLALHFFPLGRTRLARRATDHVAQSGKRVRAGQEVRVINLPADAEKGFGLFEELHEFDTADEFARYLQRASRDYYGAPIRTYLRRVAGSLDKVRKDYRTFENELLAEMLPKNAASEVSRVAHRFALAAFAGELATNYGLTGWQPDDATAAIKSLFQTWLDCREIGRAHV